MSKEEFNFDLKAKEALDKYLNAIQKALETQNASKKEKNDIIQELNEHILQAYWKENKSTDVKIKQITDIIETFGPPKELASEYLMDVRLTPTKEKTEIKKSLTYKKVDFKRQIDYWLLYYGILIVPFIFAVFVNLSLIYALHELRETWLIYVLINDLILAIPFIIYFIYWRNSNQLNKWKFISPRLIQYYILVAIGFLLINMTILPFVNFKASIYLNSVDTFYSNRADNYDRFKRFYISWEFIAPVYIVNLILISIFTLAFLRVDQSWGQFGFKNKFKKVELPSNIMSFGGILLQTHNTNPFPLNEIKLLLDNPSKDLDIKIYPSTHKNFSPNEKRNWKILFAPKTGGSLTLGRIIQKISSEFELVSPEFFFTVQELRWITKREEIFTTSELETISIGEPKLNELLEGCPICRKKFIKTDKVVKCPKCGIFFHHDHLQEWLKGHDSCPKCLNKMTLPTQVITYGTILTQKLEQMESDSHQIQKILNE